MANTAKKINKPSSPSSSKRIVQPAKRTGKLKPSTVKRIVKAVVGSKK